MESVKTVRIGDNLIISGADKAAVEAAAQAVAKRGGTVVSNVELMGHKWIVTCAEPQQHKNDCELVRLGHQVMIKGPNVQVVSAKVRELVKGGAKVISAPSEATGGGWVAVCDEAEHRRTW